MRISIISNLFLLSAVALFELSRSPVAAEDTEDDEEAPKFKTTADYMKDFDKACPKFKCAGGLTPVPKSRQKYESTGCGGMQGGAQMITVSNNEKEDEQAFSPCCDQWHACYSVCGMSKQSCDDGYKTCWEKRCGKDEECKKDADMAGIFIKFGGCHTYNSAQYMACECVNQSKAEDKREGAIRGFYKKYAPENMDKVPELASKVKDSASKVAGLLVKLLAKYPEAIKKKTDPTQELYKKAFQDAEKAEASSGKTVDTEVLIDIDEVHEL
jgi:Group XII secretory phospholipase A2 precursor (PLA2G12)